MSKLVPAFAIVCTSPTFCPDTDGYMGDSSFVYERFLTKHEADAKCDALSADSEEVSFRVEMRPFKEGEENKPRPMYSLLETYYDSQASAENCPEWAM